MDPITQALQRSLSMLAESIQTESIQTESIQTESIQPKRLIVGLSGGLDSVVLLHGLVQLQRRQDIPPLEAVYINHGLSPNANSWQAFCASYCASLAVPFAAYTVDVVPASRESLEACARERRYAALARHAKACHGIILTAHHRDDQVETVLLQLKRGAGPKGLAGIPAMNMLHGVMVTRPLLDISRKQIETYAQAQQLAWIEDESNMDEGFDRNFLRQQILTPVMSRWPAFGQTVARSASLCAEQQQLLDEVCDERLPGLCSHPERISVSGLKRYSVAWQKALIRRWLEHLDVRMPGIKQLGQLLLMLEAKSDAQPVVVLANSEFRRFRDELYWLPVTKPAKPFSEVELALNIPMSIAALGLQITLSDQEIAGGYSFSIADKRQIFMLTKPALSITIQPLGEPHHKPLKQWLKLWDIPPWNRTDVYLLRDSSQALAVLLKDRVLPLASVGNNSVYLQLQTL